MHRWSPVSSSGPGALARALIPCLTIGLVWQFVLVVAPGAAGAGHAALVGAARGAVAARPAGSSTGRRGGRLWLILPVLMLAFFASGLVPSLSHDAEPDFGTFLTSDAGPPSSEGHGAGSPSWSTLWVFNSVLGEELLFRGYLLPRMAGVFGRWDWLANGVLFAGYHLHMWWAMPRILLDALTMALPSRDYRSALIGIAVHSTQSVFICALVLPIVLAG